LGMSLRLVSVFIALPAEVFFDLIQMMS
jgi:hypothetical protein